MHYKVCILAAGAGSRMGEFSQHIHKALLPINFKATLSHIIEKFPPHLEIVIAVGYKKETVIDYLTLAHPDRRFTFVEIKDYVGPGTGPGFSLLQCRKELNCPFLLVTADTIVLENIPEPNKNWYGIAEIKNPEEYCTVKIKNNLVYQIDDKVKTNNRFAWIGLAAIYDHPIFFSALEKNKDVIAGEIQVSNGFKELIEKKLACVKFTWFDTGTFKKYHETNRSFSGDNKPFDFSKSDEFLFFINERVIKFFSDKDIVNKRCARARLLKGLCPPIEAKRGNFYTYKKVDGQTLYSILNNQLLSDFLSWAQTFLWDNPRLTAVQQKKFTEVCRQFYIDKTMDRLNTFYEKTGIEDTAHTVNGVYVPPLKELLSQVNWDYLCAGLPSTIHGDLQFDNILVTNEQDNHRGRFILLDWRQDFGGLTEMGDLYYDLAKLYGGMTLSYQLIKEGMFSLDMGEGNIFYKYYLKNDLQDARQAFEYFLKKNNFDLSKVKFITSLIFLNMSALHKDSFNLLLYFLGKKMLFDVQNSAKTTDKVSEMISA